MENKKFGNKKLYLITGAVIILCAIIIAIVLTSKGDSTNKKLETQLNLGNSYMDELDYEAAIAAYEEAIRIEPKSEEAYIALANAYIAQEEYEKAIEVLDEGYAQTEAVAILDKKDEIVLLFEEIEEAERQAELEAQVTPTPVPTPIPAEPAIDPYQEKIDQAKQYIENEEYEEAIAELESAIELDATNELAYQELAQLYESLKDYEAALEILDKGIENTDSEELVSYREQISQELERLNEIAEAERQAELAAQATPTPILTTVWTEREDGSNGNYIIREYDINGNEVKNTGYNADGTVYGSNVYEYDANGYKVKSTHYNADGTVDFWFVHEYDANGYEIKHTYYNASGIVWYWVVSEYDVNGYKVKQTQYYADGTWLVNEYDANGYAVKQTQYNADGTVSGVWER